MVEQKIRKLAIGYKVTKHAVALVKSISAVTGKEMGLVVSQAVEDYYNNMQDVRIKGLVAELVCKIEERL